MAFNKEKVMDAARKFVDKGQVDKAIKEYLRVVKEDPQDVRVWLKIGDLYAKKGSKQEATETYLKVARYYQEQGFFLKAVAVYKQILKLDPRLVEVNLKLAELYRQLGLLSDAMQHFESVAAHFHREGKTKEALATVRQLVDLDPENIATRIKLAELYSKEQMNAEAVVEFQVACDQLRKQNRVDDFVKVAERLLWHKADNLPLNRELAQLYLRRNDPRRALQKLQISFKADPRDVETLALLAQAFQALDQKSKTVSVLKELARVFDENKQRDKAEEVHRKILQFVPQDADSLAYLGDKARQPAPAPPPQPFKPVTTPMPPPMDAGRRLNLTQDVAAMDPRMTGSLPLIDSPEFSLPDYEEAEAEVPAEDLSEELALDDGYASARSSSHAGEEHAEEINKILTETDVYIKYGLHQKAIDHLRRVFALDGENLEARERLKDVLQSQGREREAIAELMKLAEATAAGDPDRAEGYLREVLALDGTYRPAFDLARRFKLDIAAVRPAGSEGEIDLDSDALRSGAVAPIDDDLDFDDIDFGEASGRRSAVGMARADSFDGIDPAIFHGQQHAQLGNARPAIGVTGDATRQVAASEVEALAAMSTAPRSLEFEDGVVETPVPLDVRGAAWQAPRSLDDVLDEHLDDALGDEIDQEVADELSGAVHVGDIDGYEVAPASGEFEAELPVDEFDPEDARSFDIGLGKRAPVRDAYAEVPQTFDPAAAAAFDADRPHSPYATPSAADLGAAPADPSDFPPPSPYDDDDGDDGPSLTVDVPPDELAQSYDGGYTVDAPVIDDSFDAHASGGYEGGTVDASYEEPYQDDYQEVGDDGGLEVQDSDVQDSVDLSATDDRPPASLEDDLDEVDFYISQDMLVEAADLLRSLLARAPGHPLVTAKLRDVEAQASGVIHDEVPIAASGGTQNIDLDEIEELAPDDAIEEEEPYDEPVDEVEEVLATPSSVKPAVMLEKPVDEGDAETHYDLGLAYKEMGLYDEAIKAFSKLKHHPVRSVQARIMIGMCMREQGNLSEAIQQFKAGLHAAQVTDRERQSLFYEIGTAYEALGDAREALYYYDNVLKRDPAFLDVPARAAKLRNSANSGRHSAVDDSGEIRR